MIESFRLIEFSQKNNFFWGSAIMLDSRLDDFNYVNYMKARNVISRILNVDNFLV